MQIQNLYYVIDENKNYLCKDGKFRGCFAFGFGKKDTSYYKNVNNALKRAQKVDGLVVFISDNGLEFI